MQSQKIKSNRIILIGKPYNITVIQVYVPMNDAEEVETEQFDEDLWELMPPSKDVFFIRD